MIEKEDKRERVYGRRHTDQRNDHAQKMLAESLAVLRWMSHTIHVAHHGGEWKMCPRTVCRRALQTLAKVGM